MFDRHELDRLLDAMRRTGVTLLEIEGEQELLRLALPASAPLAPQPRTAPARSPDIGRFRPRGGDDGLAALAPGDAVRAGEILGYVAGGAVCVPVIAPAAGRISAGMPETGALLGYGDTVFTLEITP